MTSYIHFSYADTSRGQVHYREMGSGPPVVLLHQSPLSGATFDHILPLLSRYSHAIAPDIPGYGASQPPPHLISIEEYTHRISLFLDALKIDKVALVGHHTGAAIGIQLAVDQPGRVQALVVVGVPLFKDDEREKWRNRYDDNYYRLHPDGSHLIDMWKYYRNTWGENTPLEATQFYVTEFLKGGSRWDWGYRSAFEFDAYPLLPKISCPTLYLVAEGDVLRNKNEEAVCLTPHADGRVLDSPHGGLFERDPETVSVEILSFFKRVGYITIS